MTRGCLFQSTGHGWCRTGGWHIIKHHVHRRQDYLQRPRWKRTAFPSRLPLRFKAGGINTEQIKLAGI